MLQFYKYQGTGNDFIMIDNRNKKFPKNNTKLIENLCHRKFGIGADGLILLENHSETDFRMVYFNSDGNQSSMCGNGGRCLVAFAKQLGIIEQETNFIATDGLHYATINQNNEVALQMKNVSEIKITPNYCFLNTGSPHHVQIVQNLAYFNVFVEGKAIREGELYGKTGCNVNFVEQINNNTFAIRTYERGVENETLSCGTGATAVAIAMFATKKTNCNEINIKVQGGNVKVAFIEENGAFKNVYLTGPAQIVFSGNINL